MNTKNSKHSKQVIDTSVPAPGCYCSAHACDFCNGYRHALRRDLSSPRLMKEVAQLLGRSTKEVSRMTSEQITVEAAASIGQ